MKKFLSTLIIASLLLSHTSALSAFADSTLQGGIEKSDSQKKKTENLFTGEVDQLDSKDTIIMSVSQVLSSGYTESGDEFFAEVANEVSGDKGVILPTGTIAHGFVREIKDSKRMGRDGWIEVGFDYLITPDGREIPIKGQMTTKMNPVVGTAKNVAVSTGYTAVGGVVGGFVALNMFGLPAAIASNGYTLAGGAAVGGAVGLGMALYRKGKDVLISPGDEIRVKVSSSIQLPVFSKEALKQEEIFYEGLNVKITNIGLEKDPFGEENTITLSLVITNLTDKYFTGFDIALLNDMNSSYYPSVFGDTTLMFSKIKPGDRISGKVSFAVDNVKRKHWLVFYDRAQRAPIAKLSIDNAKREIDEKNKKEKGRSKKASL